MKTALQVVIGLASQADVTILDEPTNGLDAGMRKSSMNGRWIAMMRFLA